MQRLLALIIWLAVVLIIALAPWVDEARADHCGTSWEDIVSLVGYYSDDVYGVDKRVLYRVAQIETGTHHCRNGQVVIGDGGHSVGVFQLHDAGAWHDPANPWRWMGLNARYDAEVNVRFAAWYLWRYGHMCPWTAYRVAYPGACR